jgi:hypothetical protein
MQASRLGFSPALEKRAGGLSNCVRLSNYFGPQHSAAFPPEPGTGLLHCWCRGRTQTPPFPCIPIPLLFTMTARYKQSAKSQNLETATLCRTFGLVTRVSIQVRLCLQQKPKKSDRGWTDRVIADIAVNADIARDHAEIGKAKPSETHANVGGVGMTAHKPFGILVELWGRGGILGVQIGRLTTWRVDRGIGRPDPLLRRRERHGEIRYRNSLKRCSSSGG